MLQQDSKAQTNKRGVQRMSDVMKNTGINELGVFFFQNLTNAFLPKNSD